MNSSSTDIKEVRKFGFVALAFFGFLCALGVWKGKPIPTYLFGFLAAIGVGFVLAPARMKPVHTTWLKVAHLIGRIITTLILALAYYLVITPSAMLKRVFGGRPLPLKPDRSVPSYWVERNEPVQPRERFLKRY